MANKLFLQYAAGLNIQAAVDRLVGAEQHCRRISKVNDEWLVERSRDMHLETIAPSAMIPLSGSPLPA